MPLLGPHSVTSGPVVEIGSERQPCDKRLAATRAHTLSQVGVT